MRKLKYHLKHFI